MAVLCIGEMLIDFTPYEGETLVYKANPGGAPANVAVSLARNGIDTGFMGKLGDDDFGRLLKRTLEENNITHLCPELTPEATTTLAFVTLDQSGDRKFTFARKPGADMLLAVSDVDKIDFNEYDLIHAGSVSQSGSPSRDAVAEALRRAKDAGKLVSFDINFRDKIWSFDECLAEVNRLLPYIDLLKISDEELDFVGGEDNILKFMSENSISVIVLTRGGEGARVFFGGSYYDIPSMKVQVKDTTGAGDAYWGGFLSCLLDQGVKNVADLTSDKLIAAGKYGAVSGGLCITKSGGIPAIPTSDEIRAAL